MDNIKSYLDNVRIHPLLSSMETATYLTEISIYKNKLAEVKSNMIRAMFQILENMGVDPNNLKSISMKEILLTRNYMTKLNSRYMSRFTKCPRCIAKLVEVHLKVEGASMICPFCESVY